MPITLVVLIRSFITFFVLLALVRLMGKLQVDIDHDYVNSIEEDFVKLDGYIDSKEKGNSLATILLVQDTWDNIGSL